VWVFVECKKTAKREELGDAWWYLILNNESQDLGEDVEAALVVRLIGAGEAVRLECICEVAKRTVGCAWLEGA
jgi:hypothetical protein